MSAAICFSRRAPTLEGRMAQTACSITLEEAIAWQNYKIEYVEGIGPGPSRMLAY